MYERMHSVWKLVLYCVLRRDQCAVISGGTGDEGRTKEEREGNRSKINVQEEWTASREQRNIHIAPCECGKAKRQCGEHDGIHDRRGD